jgi:ribonuclease HI
MPSVECDPDAARDRLEDAGVVVTTVVVQGSNPPDLLPLLRSETGGRAHVYFDGASRRNPGPAAIGWVLVTDEGIVDEGGDRIGETTNNRAEYAALIRALEAAAGHGFDAVDVRGDSQLVVRQVRGEYDTNNPDLRERRVRVRELLERFDRWSIEHVPREVNDRADTLANEAFDDV